MRAPGVVVLDTREKEPEGPLDAECGEWHGGQHRHRREPVGVGVPHAADEVAEPARHHRAHEDDRAGREVAEGEPAQSLGVEAPDGAHNHEGGQRGLDGVVVGAHEGVAQPHDVDEALEGGREGAAFELEEAMEGREAPEGVPAREHHEHEGGDSEGGPRGGTATWAPLVRSTPDERDAERDEDDDGGEDRVGVQQDLADKGQEEGGDQPGRLAAPPVPGEEGHEEGHGEGDGAEPREVGVDAAEDEQEPREGDEGDAGESARVHRARGVGEERDHEGEHREGVDEGGEEVVRRIHDVAGVDAGHLQDEGAERMVPGGVEACARHGVDGGVLHGEVEGHPEGGEAARLSEGLDRVEVEGDVRELDEVVRPGEAPHEEEVAGDESHDQVGQHVYEGDLRKVRLGEGSARPLAASESLGCEHDRGQGDGRREDARGRADDACEGVDGAQEVDDGDAQEGRAAGGPRSRQAERAEREVSRDARHEGVDEADEGEQAHGPLDSGRWGSEPYAPS